MALPGGTLPSLVVVKTRLVVRTKELIFVRMYMKETRGNSGASMTNPMD